MQRSNKLSRNASLKSSVGGQGSDIDFNCNSNTVAIYYYLTMFVTYPNYKKKGNTIWLSFPLLKHGRVSSITCGDGTVNRLDISCRSLGVGMSNGPFFVTGKKRQSESALSPWLKVYDPIIYFALNEEGIRRDERRAVLMISSKVVWYIIRLIYSSSA